MRKLKVAMFAGSMLPGHDGVTRVIYNWLRHASRLEIMAFSPMIPKQFADQRFYKVPSIKFPASTNYRLALPTYLFFKKRLDKFRPDIIHINSPCTLGYIAASYGNDNNIPVVATYHTHFTSYAKYYKMRLLEKLGWEYLRRVYGKCELVYVPSSPILRELGRHGIKNT